MNFMKLPTTNLENFGCPKIELLLGQEKMFWQTTFSFFARINFLQHCTGRKSKAFFNWIQNVQ